MLKKVPVGLMCLLMGAMPIAGPATAQISPNSTVRSQPTPGPILAQTPRWSDVTLTLEDLPAGFTAMPPAELAKLERELSQDSLDVENVFAFVAQQQFQLIMGITTLLETQQQQEKFDELLRDPERLKTLLAENLENTDVPPQPLGEIDNIGDAAAGVSLKVDLDDVLARLEILVFRTDRMGAFVFVLYRDGQRPVYPISEVARQLDRRAQVMRSRRK